MSIQSTVNQGIHSFGQLGSMFSVKQAVQKLGALNEQTKGNTLVERRTKELEQGSMPALAKPQAKTELNDLIFNTLQTKEGMSDYLARAAIHKDFTGQEAALISRLKTQDAQAMKSKQAFSGSEQVRFSKTSLGRLDELSPNLQKAIRKAAQNEQE